MVMLRDFLRDFDVTISHLWEVTGNLQDDDHISLGWADVHKGKRRIPILHQCTM